MKKVLYWLNEPFFWLSQVVILVGFLRLITIIPYVNYPLNDTQSIICFVAGVVVYMPTMILRQKLRKEFKASDSQKTEEIVSE